MHKIGGVTIKQAGVDVIAVLQNKITTIKEPAYADSTFNLLMQDAPVRLQGVR